VVPYQDTMPHQDVVRHHNAVPNHDAVSSDDVVSHRVKDKIGLANTPKNTPSPTQERAVFLFLVSATIWRRWLCGTKSQGDAVFMAFIVGRNARYTRNIRTASFLHGYTLHTISARNLRAQYTNTMYKRNTRTPPF